MKKTTKKDESWRGAIIVVFKEETTRKRRREIVSRLRCKFMEGFDGDGVANVIEVTPGEDEAMVAKFSALSEVEAASLNTDSGMELS